MQAMKSCLGDSANLLRTSTCAQAALKMCFKHATPSKGPSGSCVDTTLVSSHAPQLQTPTAAHRVTF